MYERQVATAKRLIKKYANNQLSTWRKSNASPPDSTQPWKTAKTSPTPTDYKVYIVFVSPGNKLAALFHLVAGTSIPFGGPSGLMAQAVDAISGTSFEPDINDTVIDPSGESFVIKDFNIVKPDGVTAILYKLDFE